MRRTPSGGSYIVIVPPRGDEQELFSDFDEDEESDESSSEAPAGPLFLTRLCLELDVASRDRQRDAIRFLQTHRERLGLEGEGGNLLQSFLERVWPGQVPATLIASNVSFESKHPEWLLRPVSHGPLAETYAAAHHTLAMNVYRRQGRLVVRRFEVTPHVAPRGHELELSAPLFWNPTDLWMERDDFDALGTLPFHRAETRRRLDSWRQYLQWKEEWIKKQQIRVPYLAWQWEGEARMSFLVKESELAGRRIQGEELSVIPLEPEEDESDNEQSRPKRPSRAPDPIEVGEVDGSFLVDPRDRRSRQSWQAHLSGNAPLRQLNLRLDEDHARRLMQKENPFPEKGLLISSIAGDLAPLQNQRRAIDRLQNSQGFCPRLADFVFSAKGASLPPEQPVALEPIPGTRPLNPGQLLAVSKVLAAPDLSLIQGPPGTGKTTVIAELCLRVARQGGRVLVASQTNLAVDNALNRLAERPEIRPLRLGNADRVDDDYRDFLAENVVARWFITITGACLERIDETTRLERDQERRTALLRDLQEAWNQHREARAGLEAARARMEGLARERGPLDASARDAHARANAARRRVEVLQGLRAWAEGGAALPPGVDGTELADLEPLLRDTRARLSPEDVVRTHDGLSLLDGARGRADTLKALRTHLADGRTRCEGGPPLGASPELTELLIERQRLMTSEDEAEAALLPRLNRRIRDLQGSAWSDFTRELLRLASQAFFGAPPVETQRISGALNPGQALLPLLDRLDGMVLKASEAADFVTRALAELAPELGRWADQALFVQQSAAREASAAQAEVARRDQERDALDAQLRRWSEAADQAQARWKDAWGALHPEDPSGPPSLSEDALRSVTEQHPERQREDAAKLERRRRWRGIQRDWVQRLQKPSESDRDHLQGLYLRHANVVGMTCNEAGKRKVFEDPNFRPFDMVIIDEVSKATPTELIMPMLLGNKVVLVGDHRQLPPMFREREASFSEAQAEGEIDQATFERYRKMVTSSLFQELFEAAPEELKTMLWVQYRMHPQVMDAVNQFYGGRLKPGAVSDGSDPRKALDAKRQHHLSIPDGRGGLLLEPHQHLLWVDSSWEMQGKRHWEEQSGTSKLNRLEVELVLKMLRLLNQALQARGYGRHDRKTPFRVEPSEAGRSLREFIRGRLGNVPETTLDDLFEEKRVRLQGRSQKPALLVKPGDAFHVDARRQVGVLTFYGAQLRELRKKIDMEQDSFNAMELRTNTVDRFQGMERPIVIASLVRAARGTMGEFVRQFQRVNVGFSRAQELLVVIGSAETFKPALIDLPPLEGGTTKPVAVYNNIFDIAQTAGGRRHAWQLLP